MTEWTMCPMIFYDTEGTIREMAMVKVSHGEDLDEQSCPGGWGMPMGSHPLFINGDEEWTIGQVVIETPLGCFDYPGMEGTRVPAGDKVSMTVDRADALSGVGLPVPCQVRGVRHQDAMGSRSDDTELGRRTGTASPRAVGEVGQDHQAQGG